MSSAVKRKKKRRSQAPVALVYFVTMIIFMALLSMLSIYLLKEFHIIGEEQEEEPVVSNQTFNDLFARVNTKNVLTEMTLIRIDPESQSILVVPMSSFTVYARDTSKTMRDVYEQDGMAGVTRAVEETFRVSIDNYATLSNEAFERVADVCGGITYTSLEELYYLSEDNDANDISIAKGELVTLSGRQIRLLTQYPVFADGRQGNVEFLGEAVESLINGAFQQANITIDNLDNIYGIMTSNSDTDMSSDNFKLQKSYLKDMLSSGIVPASRLTPEGTWTNNERFEVSNAFVTELREKMAEDVPEFETGSAAEEASAG